MPIVDLQRRLHEIGRIRIGQSVAGTSRSGRATKRPVKLDTFRLTSRHRDALDAAAELYGGQVAAWDDQWEVVTTVSSLPVVVPPGDIAFSQWLELWSVVGCVRRCDGVHEVISDGPCVCKTQDDPEAPVCAPHTRLSVMLRDLPGLGVWRLDTQGWHAATELGGAVEVCQQVMARGRLLPATLRLEQREQRRPGQPVHHFAVPVLDVGVRLDALGLILDDAAHDPALAAAPRAIESPSFTPAAATDTPPAPDLRAQLAAADRQADQAAEARRARKNAAAPIPPTGVRPSGGPPSPDPSPPSSLGPGEDDRPGPAPHPNRVAIAAREAGLDDDGRHLLAAYVSAGRTRSSKDLTLGEQTHATWLARLLTTGYASLVATDVTVDLTIDLPRARADIKQRLAPYGQPAKDAWRTARLPSLGRVDETTLVDVLAWVDQYVATTEEPF